MEFTKVKFFRWYIIVYIYFTILPFILLFIYIFSTYQHGIYNGENFSVAVWEEKS